MCLSAVCCYVAQDSEFTISLLLIPFSQIFRDLSKNLEAMKQWNAKRKMVLSALAVKTCVKFTLAGQRYRQGLLAAARRAKELEEKGISWELPKDEIKRRETAFHKNSAKNS